MTDRKRLFSQVNQNSPEWYEAHENFLGASAVADIFGIGFSSAKERFLIQSRKKKKVVSLFGQAIMDDGHYFENQLLTFLEIRGWNFVKPGMYISKIYPDLGASLDAILFGANGNLYNLEIKAAIVKPIPSTQFEIPARYIIQIQTQMLLTGIKTTILAYHNTEKKTVFSVIYAYPPLQKCIQLESQKFMNDVKNENINPWKRVSTAQKEYMEKMSYETEILFNVPIQELEAIFKLQ